MEDFNCDEMIDRAVYGWLMKYVPILWSQFAYSFATHLKECIFSSPQEYILFGCTIIRRIGTIGTHKS